MKQKKFGLKLIGTVLLLHAALILLSILEVAIHALDLQCDMFVVGMHLSFTKLQF